MPSIAPNFEYDIFISYRHNDNRSGWVTEFVNSLQEELAATIKEPLTIYFDRDPHDGLLETHDVTKSVEGKIRCLIFIPIISQTYCDAKSFAWQNEFRVFNELAKRDQFGRDIKLRNGNVSSRILPIRIHDLDEDDKSIIESEIGGPLRAVDFICRSGGVNRPLTSKDDEVRTMGKILYRDQVNKLANAVKEIIASLLKKPVQAINIEPETRVNPRDKKKTVVFAVLLMLLSLAGYLLYSKIFSAGNNFADTTAHQRGEKSLAARSIIILPFKSPGPEDTKDEYFLNGFTSAIITKLTNTKELTVISEAISFSYKTRQPDFKTVSDELKVDYVVQGQLQRVNDEVKISLTLTDTHSGFQLWAEQWERNSREIFEVQGEISAGILKALELKPVTKTNNLGKEMTESIEAYEFYLKGKFYSNSETETDLDTSILFLNKAIAADSKFALAYAEVSYVYGLKNFWFDPKGGWDERAVVSAEKALTLDRNLPEAIFAKAFCNWTLKNNFPHESVIRECNRALTFSPGLDRVHNQLGLVYMHVGLLEEGLAEAKIASSLDSYSGFDLGSLGSAYLFLQQYENSLRVLKQIPENFIGFPFRKSFLALALINLGREDEAKSFLLNALKIDPLNYATNSAYAILLAKQGDRINAMRTIRIVENAKVRANHFHHAAYNIGIAYAFLNEKEKSLSWLKWSAENGFPSYSTFRNDPLLKNMQDYPPFIELLSSLKTEMGIYKKLVQENI